MHASIRLNDILLVFVVISSMAAGTVRGRIYLFLRLPRHSGGAQPVKGTGTDAFVSLLPWHLGRGPFPTEGTIGTVITIDGSNFGDKKGKVLIGEVAAKIAKDGWTDAFITCEIKKPMATGQHDTVSKIYWKAKGAYAISFLKYTHEGSPSKVAQDPEQQHT